MSDPVDAGSPAEPGCARLTPTPFVLERIARTAATVCHADMAALCLVTSDLRMVVATDDRVTAMESEVGQELGPAFRAIRSGVPVLCDDLEDDVESLEYAARARALDIAAVAALQISLDHDPIGALVLHRRRGCRWPDETLAIAAAIAATAADYIGTVLACADAQTLGAQLQHALDSRIVIEQAKGMIAERHRMDTEAAFEMLRDRARRTSTTLREVCAAVVDGDLNLVDTTKGSRR